VARQELSEKCGTYRLVTGPARRAGPDSEEASVAASDVSTPNEAGDETGAGDDQCPVETAVGVIGGKWKVLILWHLQEQGTLRFAELQRALGGVTQKVLSEQLRDLERDGMITRRVFPEVPPRVEYALSPLGRTLRGPLAALCEWGELYLAAARPAQPRDTRALARESVPG
jgi:DNA-binding HxlR family transcriptional regulator